MRGYLATKFRAGMVGPRDKDILDNLERGTAALDTISEKTANAGVTADGVLLKDGNVTASVRMPSGTVAIASGAITATKGFHVIDTEASAATDDLDTISGGVDGMLLVIRAANDSRDVVAKDGTGNLALAGDCTLDNTQDTLTLIYDATLSKWIEISRSNNGV